MRLDSTPILARGRDVRPLLLGGMKRLFLSVRPHACRKRLTDERLPVLRNRCISLTTQLTLTATDTDAATANLLVQLIQCQMPISAI